MSAGDAFWTLRILPRIGSSAWNSRLRASLAVPSALSPSTMNSSLRSTSSLRQSASLAGSDEVSSAFLRRWSSLCCRAATRVRAARDDLVEDGAACALSPRLVEVRQRLELLGHDVAPRSRDGRRGAEHLLGLALELRLGQPDGDDGGEPLEHVVLDDVVLGRRAARRAARSCSLSVLRSARSKPATWVPPLGVAMMLTKRAHGRCRSRSPTAARCRRRARARPPAGSCGPARRAPAPSRVKWPAPCSRSDVADRGVRREVVARTR